ncbi:AraC family transcriptional regulator [Agrobacterium tumefaciens]|uniref:AraC family transcriptional regulator n=2 Tax=Rhizobium rhizogenes TaxID=359 RepID=A0AA92C5Q5_RHIRH|nr:AraC family transcriptional regulator [Rhizobium rhizogenes]PVE64972.1 AraC family transcriptional regulator [Agrobacterium tumefaciens]PVE74110.1 AraC family transcriptional regulator [Sphingomonas sp. TPD3009]
MIAILVSNMSYSFEGIEDIEQLAVQRALGLERSCVEFQPGVRVVAESRGIERTEVRFHGNGFTPHRHDTYALGLTLHGVQTFRYRGVERFSMPGNVIVLHPDEVHDGAAGTDAGLIYRMVYMRPELIGAIDGYSRSLPFVPDPVVANAEFSRTLAYILSDLDHEPDDLAKDDAIQRIGTILSREAGAPRKQVTKVAQSAVLRARDFLLSHSDEPVRSATLENITGLDRYALARHFTQLLGTSPHRYLVMRRLSRAKQLLLAGSSLAGAAVEAGFADQAHLTRHFRDAFGITPGRWLALQGGRA